MAKRTCYQCDGDLDEIQARRRAEVRAWADEQIRLADQALIGVPLFEDDFEELDTTPEELEPEVVEPEPEPVVEVVEPTKAKKSTTKSSS